MHLPKFVEFGSNSRGICLSSCLTVLTSCLLHFAIATLYFVVLPFSFQHWCLLLFPLWTKWKTFGFFCTLMLHGARSQVSCIVTIYPSRHLSFLTVFPHYPSPWWYSRFFSLPSLTALTSCLSLVATGL